MGFINFVVFTSLFFLILSFLLYTPLPKVVEEPWVYRTVGIATDLAGILAVTGNKLTGWPQETILRNIIALNDFKVYQNYPELEVEDLRFEGVPVRLYKPKSVKGPSPCVIFLHGGGWVVLNINSYDSVTTQLALRTGMIVVTVDYRLAPENPYPAPLDDCLKATKYVLQNGQVHDIDVNRVAIAGDSAGGNMATVVALRLTEESRSTMPPLKVQVLIYPVTQMINFRTSSYQLYGNYPILSRRAMILYICAYFQLEWNSTNIKALETNHHITSFVRRPLYSKFFKDGLIPSYVRPNLVKDIVDPFDDDANEDVARKLDSLAVDPYVSPLLADDLSKLPPAYVLVTEFDVLRDDGLLYADRLKEAGVKVTMSYVKGQPHVFMAPIMPYFGFQGNIKEWEKIYAYLKDNL